MLCKNDKNYHEYRIKCNIKVLATFVEEKPIKQDEYR